MKRRTFITTLASALLVGTPVFAQSVRESVISQLTNQGFAKVTVSRTLLGRMRFVAVNQTYQREIVINPTTGEVLRDYLIELATGKPPSGISINPPPSSEDNSDDGNDGEGEGDDGEGESEGEGEGDGGDD